MQRLITVSVDIKQLLKSPTNPFSINEVDSVNELLEQGWEIEEWDFLKEDSGDGEILLLVTLNDEAMFGDEDDIEDDFNFDHFNDLDVEEAEEVHGDTIHHSDTSGLIKGHVGDVEIQYIIVSDAGEARESVEINRIIKIALSCIGNG